MQNYDLESSAEFQTEVCTDSRLQISEVVFSKPSRVDEQAHAIIAELMPYRRMVKSEPSCQSKTCLQCAWPHLEKIYAAMAAQQPITFVLPAFPGKSPNSSKVLGPLPDMAEQRSLQFLNHLCRRIGEIYKPGARIIICSDGRVFSDVVGMAEADITAYQQELERLIEGHGLENLSTFNLDAFCEGGNFDQIRQDLMDQYGQSLETLQEKISRGSEGLGDREDDDALRMYCGITRFLFEDAMFPGQKLSRTAIQKQARVRAYEVIRRSNAWSELIAERFPTAVRLSIHPQICGARKLGIQLLGDSSWMTPWHGVAVDKGGEFVLMKRWEAMKLGGSLVFDNSGRASHFQMLAPARALKELPR